RSHGPAQVQDFAWWSGLTMVEIRKGIHLVGGALERETMDGKDFWSDPKAARAGRIDPLAHLLPNFDELTVAYRDRGALLDPRVPFNPSFFAYYRESTPQGGMLSNVVTIAGRVRGAWSRTLAPKLVRVHVRPLAPFSASDVEAVDAAAKKLGRFLQLNAEVRAS
ncbi:MAG: winged helix DNA-binding domain-containing protein, partial [Chloroflexi bacterium]